MHFPSLLLATTAMALSTLAAENDSKPKSCLLVTNKGDQALSIIDPTTNQVLSNIPEEGVTGHEVAASPDGRFAYVPIYGSGGVGGPGTDGQLLQVIDLAAKKIVKTIDFGKGVRPHCPIMSRARGLLYVTTEIGNTVSVIDPAKGEITGSIPTGEEQSHMLAVSRDGKRGYTANVSTGTVSVLDLENAKLLKVISVSKHVQRISLSADDKLVFTADQTRAQLAVIDTDSLQVKSWIPLPDFGYGTCPTPDGKSLLACIPNLNEVAVIDLAQEKVTATFKVPRAPQAVLVRPDGAIAYASCDASGQVAALNLREGKVDALISTGKKADGLAWAETP